MVVLILLIVRQAFFLSKFQCPIFCCSNDNKYQRTMHTFPQNKFITFQQNSICLTMHHIGVIDSGRALFCGRRVVFVSREN